MTTKLEGGGWDKGHNGLTTRGGTFFAAFLKHMYSRVRGCHSDFLFTLSELIPTQPKKP